MLLAAAILVVELAFLIVVGPRTGVSRPGQEVSRTTDRDPPAEEEPTESRRTPAREVAPDSDSGSGARTNAEPDIEPASLETATTHTIRAGDNLFRLSERYWDDGRLWPIVYYANREDLADPDLLRVGHILSIPYLTADPVAYARSAKDLSALSHLEAYRAYREVGEHLVAEGIRRRNVGLVRAGRRKEEKARWVLYAAGWFVPTFPDGFTDRIADEDLMILRAYQQRFGPPFADR